jgi:hypothetical protein
MAKPTFFRDDLEVRRNGQTVGRSQTFSKHGEALGRTWVKRIAALNGEAVPVGEPHDTSGFRSREDDADRVEYGLTWGEGGEEFGWLTHDKPQREWSLHLAGKILYWWSRTPWLGGARFGFDDSDEQTYLTAVRYPLRSTTWQRITVADELPEPEAIVTAQLGHTIWHTAVLSSGAHGNAAFLSGRL